MTPLTLLNVNKAVGGGIFGQFSTRSRRRRLFRRAFQHSFRPEVVNVVSDVISGMVIDPTGMKVRVKFGDSW